MFQIWYGKTLVGFSKVHFTCPEAICGKCFFITKIVNFCFIFSLWAKTFRTLARKYMAGLSKLFSRWRLNFFRKNTLFGKKRFMHFQKESVRLSDCRQTFSHGFQDIIFGVQRKFLGKMFIFKKLNDFKLHYICLEER